MSRVTCILCRKKKDSVFFHRPGFFYPIFLIPIIQNVIALDTSRLKPEVEKQELELFRQGQFVIEDEEKEDANASTERPLPMDASVEVIFE